MKLIFDPASNLRLNLASLLVEVDLTLLAVFQQTCYEQTFRRSCFILLHHDWKESLWSQQSKSQRTRQKYYPHINKIHARKIIKIIKRLNQHTHNYTSPNQTENMKGLNLTWSWMALGLSKKASTALLLSLLYAYLDQNHLKRRSELTELTFSHLTASSRCKLVMLTTSEIASSDKTAILRKAKDLHMAPFHEMCKYSSLRS